jgi:hypothetical protein
MERAKRIGRDENPAIVAVCPPGGVFAPPAPEPEFKELGKESATGGRTGRR